MTNLVLTAKAKGSTLADLLDAGWNEATLLAEGMATKGRTTPPAPTTPKAKATEIKPQTFTATTYIPMPKAVGGLKVEHFNPNNERATFSLPSNFVNLAGEKLTIQVELNEMKRTFNKGSNPKTQGNVYVTQKVSFTYDGNNYPYGMPVSDEWYGKQLDAVTQSGASTLISVTALVSVSTSVVKSAGTEKTYRNAQFHQLEVV